jgi:23S rRNA (uracil1939-C5)-methyltransferase
VAKVKLTHSLERGDQVEVNVESLAGGGDGVAKIDSIPVFIERAAQGDRLAVHLFDVRKDFARGAIEEIVQASPERVQAPCFHYERCGGCQWQHIEYGAQLKHKHKLVADALVHIGGFTDVDALMKPIIGCDDPFHYRNKVQFPVKYKDNQVLAGYYERGSHDLVNIDACPIQPTIMDAILKSTKMLFKKYRISIYDETRHRGMVRHLNLRMSFASGKILVTMVVNHAAIKIKEFNNIDYLNAFTVLGEELIHLHPEVESVVVNFNQDKGNRILGEHTLTLVGNGFIEEKLATTREDLPVRLREGLTFRLSPKSFFQVNSLQAVKLLELIALGAQKALAGVERPVIVDAYAGVGTIAMWLSPLADKVIAIEEVGDAITDGEENANLNDLANVSFLEGRVEQALSLAMQEDKVDLVVFDPPRKGIDPAILAFMREKGPQHIIYVSCNPATLARDLKILGQPGENGEAAGYKTTQVQPVDLFPQTYHVESVALLERV